MYVRVEDRELRWSGAIWLMGPGFRSELSTLMVHYLVYFSDSLCSKGRHLGT